MCPFCSFHVNVLLSFSEGPVISSNGSMPLMFRGEEVVEFPQEELPVKLSQGPTPTENLNLANNFPTHIFEPAVMLTPPRQKSNSEFSPLQDGKHASPIFIWKL
jgi:spindle and centriole-associated protein 1